VQRQLPPCDQRTVDDINSCCAKSKFGLYANPPLYCFGGEDTAVFSPCALQFAGHLPATNFPREWSAAHIQFAAPLPRPNPERAGVCVPAKYGDVHTIIHDVLVGPHTGLRRLAALVNYYKANPAMDTAKVISALKATKDQCSVHLRDAADMISRVGDDDFVGASVYHQDSFIDFELDVMAASGEACIPGNYTRSTQSVVSDRQHIGLVYVYNKARINFAISAQEYEQSTDPVFDPECVVSHGAAAGYTDSSRHCVSGIGCLDMAGIISCVMSGKPDQAVVAVLTIAEITGDYDLASQLVLRNRQCAQRAWSALRVYGAIRNRVVTYTIDPYETLVSVSPRNRAHVKAMFSYSEHTAGIFENAQRICVTRYEGDSTAQNGICLRGSPLALVQGNADACGFRFIASQLDNSALCVSHVVAKCVYDRASISLDADNWYDFLKCAVSVEYEVANGLISYAVHYGDRSYHSSVRYDVMSEGISIPSKRMELFSVYCDGLSVNPRAMLAREGEIRFQLDDGVSQSVPLNSTQMLGSPSMMTLNQHICRATDYVTILDMMNDNWAPACRVLEVLDLDDYTSVHVVCGGNIMHIAGPFKLSESKSLVDTQVAAVWAGDERRDGVAHPRLKGLAGIHVINLPSALKMSESMSTALQKLALCWEVGSLRHEPDSNSFQQVLTKNRHLVRCHGYIPRARFRRLANCTKIFRIETLHKRDETVSSSEQHVVERMHYDWLHTLEGRRQDVSLFSVRVQKLMARLCHGAGAIIGKHNRQHLIPRIYNSIYAAHGCTHVMPTARVLYETMMWLADEYNMADVSMDGRLLVHMSVS
jgi:hypothetical protein